VRSATERACAATPIRDFTSLNLQIVAAYSAEVCEKLLRTGVALGGRRPVTMGPWARVCLSHFTDEEIAALYSYLHTMP
jgi:hypothetical protein